MPKADNGGASAPLLAQAVPVGGQVAYAQQAVPAPQVPQNVLRAAHEMQTGTGVISMDINSSLPVGQHPGMAMPPPGGMSLQQGMPGPGVHVMAMPMTPGLGMLAGVQGICIRQNIRLAELLIGFEQQNRFKIMAKPATLNPSSPLPDEISSQLPPLFFAIEDSDCLARQFCHNLRGFNVSD